MAALRPRLRIARAAFAVSLVLSAVIVGRAIFGEHGVERHEKLRGELENARVLNESLKTDNVRLKEQARALRSNPEYIEAVIRDELGWVKKDEMVFIFPSSRPEGAPVAADAGEPAGAASGGDAHARP